MNTVRKFPVSKLPRELQGGFDKDSMVTISISNESDVLTGVSQNTIDELLAPAIEHEKNGAGATLSTENDLDTHFASLRAKVDAKHKAG